MYVSSAYSQAGFEWWNFKPVNFTCDAERWPYPRHADVADHLRGRARKYPNRAQVNAIRRSGKGRDQKTITIQNLTCIIYQRGV